MKIGQNPPSDEENSIENLENDVSFSAKSDSSKVSDEEKRDEFEMGFEDKKEDEIDQAYGLKKGQIA